MSTIARSGDEPALDELDTEPEPEEEFTRCRNPGPHGCQTCDACACWGCDEYHRRKDDGYY